MVAGDHECGGLTIGFAGTQYDSSYDILQGQKVPTCSLRKASWANTRSQGRQRPVRGCQADDRGILRAEVRRRLQGPRVLQAHEIKQIEEAFARSMQGEEVQSKDPVTYNLYGGYDPLTVTLTHILNQKAGLGWTSYSHTGVPVQVSAQGVGADPLTVSTTTPTLRPKSRPSWVWRSKPAWLPSDAALG